MLRVPDSPIAAIFLFLPLLSCENLHTSLMRFLDTHLKIEYLSRKRFRDMYLKASEIMV